MKQNLAPLNFNKKKWIQFKQIKIFFIFFVGIIFESGYGSDLQKNEIVFSGSFSDYLQSNKDVLLPGDYDFLSKKIKIEKTNNVFSNKIIIEKKEKNSENKGSEIYFNQYVIDQKYTLVINSSDLKFSINQKELQVNPYQFSSQRDLELSELEFSTSSAILNLIKKDKLEESSRLAVFVLISKELRVLLTNKTHERFIGLKDQDISKANSCFKKLESFKQTLLDSAVNFRNIFCEKKVMALDLGETNKRINKVILLYENGFTEKEIILNSTEAQANSKKDLNTKRKIASKAQSIEFKHAYHLVKVQESDGDSKDFILNKNFKSNKDIAGAEFVPLEPVDQYTQERFERFSTLALNPELRELCGPCSDEVKTFFKKP